ncbi:MAG: iron chaperone [Anaerolineales bacterium]
MTDDDSLKAVNDYIAGFPPDVQHKLTLLRNLIQDLAPEASEKISYGMPTFYLHENLVHYAAYAKHIGFYPTPSGITHFEKELSPYKHAKGSVQFPLDQPLPTDLIERIVRFRVEEILKKKKS